MIVDLTSAKQQLDRLDSDADDVIYKAMNVAVQVVLDYIEVPLDTYMDSTGLYDMPEIEWQAVMLVIESLYRDSKADPLTTAVKSLLMRRHVPALA